MKPETPAVSPAARNAEVIALNAIGIGLLGLLGLRFLLGLICPGSGLAG
ncbi:MAG: hypothetical protein ACKVPX_17140 [Myxococcaceae bacterium]